MGDDTDASIVADAGGMLYVAAEYERAVTRERADAIGQLVKLDPSADVAAGEDPLLWSWSDDGTRHGGIWTTPEIGRAHVRTHVTNAHIVCRLLLEKTTTSIIRN